MNMKFVRTWAMLALVMVIGLSVTGGTIAWFTDSVSSANNVIQAGNLDVDVTYTDDTGAEKSIDQVNELFADVTRWEPGAVAWENLTVVNKGNLALKYEMAMNTSAFNSVNGYDLTGALKIGFVEGGVNSTDRNAVINSVKNWSTFSGFNAEGQLYPNGSTGGASSNTYGVVVYWEPTAEDNNWNVNNGKTTSDGKDHLFIDLGVKLEAIQHTFETDAFGNDYDRYALLADGPWDGESATTPTPDASSVYHITTAAELIGMMNDSKYPNNNKYQNVVLDCDIDLNGETISGFGDDSGFFDGIFDGQGHTISNFKIDASNRTYYAGLFNQVSQYSGENTVIKNLTVANATIIGSGQVGAIVGGMNGNTIVDNCKAINCTLMGVKKVGAVVGYTAGGTVTNNYAENCKVYYSEKEGEAILGYENTGSTVNNNKSVNVTVEKVDACSDGLLKKGTNIEVSNANGLETLNKMMANKSAGRDVIVNITDDIDFTGKTWTPVDSHADTAFYMNEINGNGHTISNLTVDGQAMFRRFAGSGDVTIKDLTFDKAKVTSSAINTSILTVQSYQNVLLDNVDVKNSSITGTYKVAPLIGSVYNESASTVTATLKNCDVSNTTVTSTQHDFCTAGMVAFVYEGNNDKIEFENCTVSNVKLRAPDDSYKSHAWIYVNDADTNDKFNEAPGVTVTNCTFEAL